MVHDFFLNPGKTFYLSRIFFLRHFSFFHVWILLFDMTRFISWNGRGTTYGSSFSTAAFTKICKLSVFCWHFTAAHHDFAERKSSLIKTVFICHLEYFFRNGILHFKMMWCYVWCRCISNCYPTITDWILIITINYWSYYRALPRSFEKITS